MGGSRASRAMLSRCQESKKSTVWCVCHVIHEWVGVVKSQVFRKGSRQRDTSTDVDDVIHVPLHSGCSATSPDSSPFPSSVLQYFPHVSTSHWALPPRPVLPTQKRRRFHPPSIVPCFSSSVTFKWLTSRNHVFWNNICRKIFSGISKKYLFLAVSKIYVK